MKIKTIKAEGRFYRYWYVGLWSKPHIEQIKCLTEEEYNENI